MKIEYFLIQNKLKKKDFAAMLEISPEHLSYIINKRRKPSRELIQKIIEKTGGQVSFQDLVK